MSAVRKFTKATGMVAIAIAATLGGAKAQGPSSKSKTRARTKVTRIGENPGANTLTQILSGAAANDSGVYGPPAPAAEPRRIAGTYNPGIKREDAPTLQMRLESALEAQPIARDGFAAAMGVREERFAHGAVLEVNSAGQRKLGIK